MSAFDNFLWFFVTPFLIVFFLLAWHNAWVVIRQVRRDIASFNEARTARRQAENARFEQEWRDDLSRMESALRNSSLAAASASTRLSDLANAGREISSNRITPRNRAAPILTETYMRVTVTLSDGRMFEGPCFETKQAADSYAQRMVNEAHKPYGVVSFNTHAGTCYVVYSGEQFTSVTTAINEGKQKFFLHQENVNPCEPKPRRRFINFDGAKNLGSLEE